MKKIAMTVAVLFITSGMGMGVWADTPSSTPGTHMTKDQAEQHRDQARQKHQKKGRHAHKVDGKAMKGTPKVSPDPVNQNN